MQTDSPLSFYGCSGLEADADNVLVYPANTYVRIVGNKRTQASLTGQEGRVIKTVGLGGWHWLELRDGSTVRVQRNALCLASDVMCDWEEASTLSERSSTLDSSDMCGGHKVRTTGGINLHRLSTAALMRYAQVHRLDVGTRASRDVLLKHVLWHFESVALEESAIMATLTGRCP